jgi:uncharacterized protein YfdQ (DUF2303 family)
VTDIDNVQTIVTTATRAAQAQPLDLGKVYAFNTPGGVHKIDLTGEDYQDQPTRKRGTTVVRDSAGFLTYYSKHHDASTEVYSDIDALSVTAVLDANTATSARWGGHRVTLGLRTTKAWREWTTASGKLMSQDAFAEFLESHLPDLVDPDAATMLEIAQSIQASTTGEFQSASRLQSGARKLIFTEETTAKAGSRGELEIPEVFKIAVIPFEGAVRYSVNARLKYRINRKELTLGFLLEQPEDRLACAFEEVVSLIAAGIDTPILNGTPA